MNEAKKIFLRLYWPLNHNQPDNDRADGTVYNGRGRTAKTAGDAGEFPRMLPKLMIRMASIMKKVARPNSSRISRQALAGDRAHASEISHHDQSESDGDHGPQQLVSELSTGLGVGDNAVGIVVHVGGDETRTDDGEEQQYPDFPASQESHVRNSRDGLERASLVRLRINGDGEYG